MEHDSFQRQQINEKTPSNPVHDNSVRRSTTVTRAAHHTRLNRGTERWDTDAQLGHEQRSFDKLRRVDSNHHKSQSRSVKLASHYERIGHQDECDFDQ